MKKTCKSKKKPNTSRESEIIITQPTNLKKFLKFISNLEIIDKFDLTLNFFSFRRAQRE